MTDLPAGLLFTAVTTQNVMYACRQGDGKLTGSTDTLSSAWRTEKSLQELLRDLPVDLGAAIKQEKMRIFNYTPTEIGISLRLHVTKRVFARPRLRTERCRTFVYKALSVFFRNWDSQGDEARTFTSPDFKHPKSRWKWRTYLCGAAQAAVLFA